MLEQLQYIKCLKLSPISKYRTLRWKNSFQKKLYFINLKQIDIGLQLQRVSNIQPHLWSGVILPSSSTTAHERGGRLFCLCMVVPIYTMGIKGRGVVLYASCCPRTVMLTDSTVRCPPALYLHNNYIVTRLNIIQQQDQQHHQQFDAHACTRIHPRHADDYTSTHGKQQLKIDTITYYSNWNDSSRITGQLCFC